MDYSRDALRTAGQRGAKAGIIGLQNTLDIVQKVNRMSLATPLPEITAPPLACDCHLHVFDDPQTYPYSAERRNTPPQMPLAVYRAGYQDWARRCGIERIVFTQPCTYETACWKNICHAYAGSTHAARKSAGSSRSGRRAG